MSSEPVMKANVLVAEDDEAVRAVVGEALSLAGFRVDTAADGAAAAAKAREHEFDVVVSDVAMPGMNGIELLRVLKQQWPEIEVVIATGQASLDIAIECLRAGAFDFVRKPIDLRGLVNTVSLAVERRRLREASVLYEASQAIFASSGTPERLPAVIVDVAGKAMGADLVSLMLPGADGRLYIAHSRGLPAEVETQATLQLGERVAGRVAKDRSPVVLARGLTSDPRFADLTSFGRVQSSIVFPLVSGTRLAGVLNLGRVSALRPYRPADLHRTSVIASQILLALENARLVRQMMASERMASIGQVAAGIAHEINNPVSYVLSGAEFVGLALGRLEPLLAGQSEEAALAQWWGRVGGRPGWAEVRKAAADAIDGARRIHQIVRDMRALSRSDLQVDEAVELESVIRTALRVASAELRGRADVVTTLDPGLRVSASEGSLSQVFVNLMVNAAHALADRRDGPRRIEIRTWRVGEKAVAEVSDNGPGVAAHHLSRLFEPFFTTKDADSGTGLGLFICREIIHRHGGEIAVESAPGAGTCFRITLPVWTPGAAVDPASILARPPPPPAPPPAPLSPPPSSPRPSGPWKMLVVDDEPLILSAYERYFAKEWQVTVATGGLAALDLLEQRQDYDVIISDFLMPDISGMELYRRTALKHPELSPRFVFVSGSRHRIDTRQFVASVRNVVFDKPVEFDVLRQVLAKIVRARR